MAKFNFLNLNSEIRNFMLDEINSDIQNDKLYKSDRLNDDGKNLYKDYLIESVKNGDEESLEVLLNKEIFFNESELKNNKISKVPSNASKLLCQSEFNRYYIRAVCIKAIKDGIDEVEIYRGRESSFSRSDSEAKIGTTLNSNHLLEDLRSSIGVAPKLFPEINSGLTIKI